MKNDPSKEQKARLAALLGEVKFAERQLEKAQAALAPREARVKQALLAGERERALEYAVALEEERQRVVQAERKVAVASQAFEQAKAQGRELREALGRKEILTGLGAIAETFQAVGGADDILAQLERENALAEARADLALERAGPTLPSDPASLLAEFEQPAPGSPEDILREFERGG